ncbi:CKB1 [Sanghuangporus weigelae]
MPRSQELPQLARLTQEPRTVAGEEDTRRQDAEVGEAMEEDVEQEGYASSTPTSSLTWISWFCALPGHEYFCEVSEDFIEDDFNLTGINAMVPFWKEAMEMVLDVEPEEDPRIPDVSIIEASAELLYGLVHQRYILTRQGLHAMAEKYEAGQFGTCPRVYCLACPVVPCGRSDLPGLDTVKLYCPNCNDIYTPPSSRYQGVDGAFFGTTFAHLFFQTYREFAPAPFYKPSSSGGSTRSPVGNQTSEPSQKFENPNQYGGQKAATGKVYTPKIYGFRVSERAKGGPRMRWLRLRPEDPAELDKVDRWGRFFSDEDSDDSDYTDGEELGDLEAFDPDDMTEGETDEAEESEGAGNKPTPGKGSGGRRNHATGAGSSGQKTLRPPTPIHGTVASSPPPSSSVASPQAASKSRKESVGSTSLSFDTRRGLNKGHPTTPIPKRVKPSHKKGIQSTRTKFVRSVVREVVGFAPYERRVMELLRNSKDKRARKLTKKRLGTLLRSKRKLEELGGIIQESRRAGH